ncbi:MAG: bifunctional 5,10-methylenetetrahydrofolate dehydrogenase/5,10-methenyltetrahydrofolate cyclohydrolase [archaeon]
MPAKIIDGKKIAEKILEKAKKDVKALKEKGTTPKLVVIQVGDDPASSIYVQKKRDKCLELGMASEIKKFGEKITYTEFLFEIEKLNKDDSVHGILIQLPLPEHLSHKQVFETIDVCKDVDGLHPANHGKNLLGKECFRPATPIGIMKILHETGVKLEGKNAVVIGRSNIVGKPIAIMLLNAGCTVTICHSKTTNLKEHTLKADILISAAGKPKLVKESMVKKGAIVIDVGTTKMKNGKLCGDVDFEKVRKKASWITPVPGGVGPMTIASVVENTVKACREITNA